MDENQAKISALFTVDAVMFGTDETILDMKLSDGFSFVRRSLIPMVDNLDELFDTNAMGLRRDYEAARIDGLLDVVCVTKCVHVEVFPSEFDDCFRSLSDINLLSLDNQIRVIRLLAECPLRCKKIMFRLSGDTHSHNHLFHVNESMTTRPISKFHCSKDAIEILNQRMEEIKLPFSDLVLNTCHLHYDLSYHQDRYIAMILLVAALEMLYLESESGKKDKLSKRCAIFLFNNRVDVLNCYNRLKSVYKKRSQFVHEGTFEDITDDDILFLRVCVRESLLRIKNNTMNKKERIKHIRGQVEAFGIWE